MNASRKPAIKPPPISIKAIKESLPDCMFVLDKYESEE